MIYFENEEVLIREMMPNDAQIITDGKFEFSGEKRK